MIISHAIVIWRKRNTPVISIHRYLVNKGYVILYLGNKVAFIKTLMNVDQGRSMHYFQGSMEHRPPWGPQ